MENRYKEEEEEDKGDIYQSSCVEDYLDDDAISSEEGGFMQGYILS